MLERAEHTFQVALSLAVGCGVCLLLVMEVRVVQCRVVRQAVLLALEPHTLTLPAPSHTAAATQLCADQLIAGTGADATLVPLAANYMRIRALAQPAVLVTMACQGGLLAQRVREEGEGGCCQVSRTRVLCRRRC